VSWVSSVQNITFPLDAMMKYLHLNPPCFKASPLLPAHSLSWSSLQLILQFCIAEQVNTLQKFPAYDVTLKYLQAATNSHLFEGFSPSTLKPWMT